MLRLATIPLFLGTVFAMPHGQAAGRIPFGMLRNPEAAQELGLSEDQQQKLEDLFYSHQEQALALRQKMEKLELELQKLMNADDPNENQIKAKIREIGALRTDLELERVEFFFKMRGVLTAEQIEKLKTMHPGMAGMERMQGRRQCPQGEPPREGPGPFNPQD